MGATVICHAEERPSPRQPRTGQLSAEEDGRTRMEPGPTQLTTISVQRAKSAHRSRLGRGRREPALAGSVSWVSHLRSEPLPAGTAGARRAGPRKARAGRGERRTRRRAAAPLDLIRLNSAVPSGAKTGAKTHSGSGGGRFPRRAAGPTAKRYILGPRLIRGRRYLTNRIRWSSATAVWRSARP